MLKKACLSHLAMIMAALSVSIKSHAQLTAYAGSSSTICSGDSLFLGGNPSATGGNPPYAYSWSAASTLNNALAANPQAKPVMTTTYTLTVTDASSQSATATVTVVVGQIPLVNAGNDTTINEGEVAILHGSGGYNYQWSPANELKYYKTQHPQADNSETTTFYVKAQDITGACFAEDSVVVNIIPSNKIIIYNTFTPNNDGSNDEWYIANIEKYPNSHLQIFNRYGKQVYEERGYKNTWSGRVYGEKLPAATYFYILNLGDGSAPYHGTVTIVE